MSQTEERVRLLREKMKEQGMDAYLIPTADFHGSEYVGEHFKCRQFMTGFTGSAGTAVVTEQEALLWVDGRYFVQAEAQLKGSPFQMMKMGEEGVPSVEAYLEAAVPEGGCLGFDGRVVNAQTGAGLEARLAKKGSRIDSSRDLVDEVWEDRPELSAEPVWILSEQYAGKSAAEKLNDVRTIMKKQDAGVHILTSLDDLAWLLNLRGNDIRYNPVFLAYGIITQEEMLLFVNPEILSPETTAYLKGLSVTCLPYDRFYEKLKEFHGERILLEKGQVNYRVWNLLADENCILDTMNPTSEAKAVKNRTEVENEKKAHIKDGVAVTRFMYWLKHQIGKTPLTEMDAAAKIEEFRSEQGGYLEPSFATISAYGPNAAMCHYSATEETNTSLEPRSFYLVDSGGQYYEGTTDITRTIALGELTAEEKEHFTLVLMSMLRLGNVKFLYGCRGLSLDYAARELFWSRGLNFNHGTGHGVGYLLNVHERPNGIRYRMVPERQDSGVLEEGMITSDEPGLYIEGKHGIRTENLILCVKDEKNEYGQFMRFEYLTFVPIDLDAVEPSLMTERDKELLNEYHAQVYEKIGPYLPKEEQEWLKEVTRPLC